MDNFDRDCVSQAVSLATANVAGGGGPFGALVVCSGMVLASGVNRVVADRDPTAHAEVVAIRAACQAVGTFALPGCTLYASCEPCPLCVAAALWARLERLVFAATRDDAAAAGFDDRVFHEALAERGGTGLLPVEHLLVPGSRRPFHAWAALADRTPY